MITCNKYFFYIYISNLEKNLILNIVWPIKMGISYSESSSSDFYKFLEFGPQAKGTVSSENFQTFASCRKKINHVIVY